MKLFESFREDVKSYLRDTPETLMLIFKLSCSDSDISAVDDRPFLDEEGSFFVPSKSYEVVVSIINFILLGFYNLLTCICCWSAVRIWKKRTVLVINAILDLARR